MLEALSPLDTSPDTVIEAMRTTAAAWRTAGRATVEAAGGSWPTGLATITQAYFDATAAGRT